MAVLAKLTPVALLPFVIRRAGWRNAALIAAVVLADCAPFLDAEGKIFEGLMKFAREWQFDAGPYALAEWLIGHSSQDPAMAARAGCGLSMGCQERREARI